MATEAAGGGPRAEGASVFLSPQELATLAKQTAAPSGGLSNKRRLKVGKKLESDNWSYLFISLPYN